MSVWIVLPGENRVKELFNMEEIIKSVKTYIADEFLDGDSVDKLSDNTPLVTGGILDSISTAQLVAFLEEKYSVQFHAHEMSVDYMDTVELIAETVHSKRG